MEPIPINDPRLTPNMIRIRAGRFQEFYEPDDRKQRDSKIRLEHPEKHFFAELINGQWCWVNGCDKCNGKEEAYGGYIRCDKHDVCCTCGILRSQLKEIPWGHVRGFQCKPCVQKQHNIEKAEALAKMGEYNEWDYENIDELKCPYCDFEMDEWWEHLGDEREEAIIECLRCDNKFKATYATIPRFTMERVE